MKVTFLGTGTSQGIPVIGCACIVCQSADARDKRLRVSVLIETEDKTIVIDSGPDFRYQMLRAGVKDLDAIIYTHEHKDHVAGLDDIRPFNYLLHKVIDIYAVPRVQEALKREFVEECYAEIEVVEHFYTTDFYEKSTFNDSQVISVYYLVKEVKPLALKFKTAVFDFDEGLCQSFRWVKIDDITADDVTFKTDKTVVDMLKRKF